MYRSFVLFCVVLFSSVAFGQDTKATRPAITGISHVTLFADDLAKSQQFYSSLLGWEQVPSGTPKSGVHFYANHLQYVELLSPPSKGLEDRLDSVAFSTSDAELLRTYLADNGVKVPSAVKVESDGDRSFAVRDPEGNKVEFTQAGVECTQRGKCGVGSGERPFQSRRICGAGSSGRGSLLQGPAGIPRVLGGWGKAGPDGLGYDAGPRWHRLARVYVAFAGAPKPRPVGLCRSLFAGSCDHGGIAIEVEAARLGSHRTNAPAIAWCRWQMAVGPRRSRRNKDRVHGVLARQEALLLSVHRTSTEPIANLVDRSAILRSVQ